MRAASTTCDVGSAAWLAAPTSGIWGDCANWDPAIVPNNYFYAFIATGNTTGGVGVVVGQKDFNNQDTVDYEAGWKGTLFDGHLFTQGAGEPFGSEFLQALA